MIAVGGINIILKDPAHVNSKKTVTTAKTWIFDEMIAIGSINIILKDPAHFNNKKTVTTAKMWELGDMIAIRSINIILKDPAHVSSKKTVTTAIMWTLFHDERNMHQQRETSSAQLPIEKPQDTARNTERRYQSFSQC